jgi:hypothetical protein
VNNWNICQITLQIQVKFGVHGLKGGATASDSLEVVTWVCRMAEIQQPGTGQPRPASRSKKALKWGSGALLAFLAFAPPGTMIVIALILTKFLGGTWFVVAGLMIIALGISAFLIFRRRASG